MAKHNIIFSSSCFLKTLGHVTFPSESMIDMKVDSRRLFIGGNEIPVESRFDFSVKIEGKSISKLIKFCRFIEDQPITVALEDSGWIIISWASL